MHALLGDPVDYYNWTPWDRLAAALYSVQTSHPIHSRLHFLAEQTHGLAGESAAGKPQSATHNERLYAVGARALLGTLPLQLEALAALSELSLAADDGADIKPPSKTKQLRKTIYLRELARVVKSLGLCPRQSKGREASFPLHHIIAITANVGLDLANAEALQGDTVRKLVEEKR